jgi:hypothetical protein
MSFEVVRRLLATNQNRPIRYRVRGTPNYSRNALQLFGVFGYELYLGKLPLTNRYNHSSFFGKIPCVTVSLCSPTYYHVEFVLDP